MPSSISALVTLIVAIVLLIAGGIVGYQGGHWVGFDEGKTAGAAAVAANLSKQGNAQADAAEAARQSSLQPGAAQRLRLYWCRDCGGQ